MAATTTIMSKARATSKIMLSCPTLYKSNVWAKAAGKRATIPAK